MPNQKIVHAQLLHPQSETMVASGSVTLFNIQTHEFSRSHEIHAQIEFDRDRVDLVSRTLLLRFNEQVSGLVTIRFSKGHQPVFTGLRRFDLEWADDRWKDLRWFNEV